jgi:hypothetical protein
MEQQVLVIAGCRQAGKSTSAKFLHGLRLKEAGILGWFDLSEKGDLLVEAYHDDGNGEVYKTRDAILDIYRRDYEFAQYAHEKIWPFIKVESFAESLKQSCIEVFSLDPQNVYGNDDDKNKLTHVKWTSVWNVLSKERKEEIKNKYPNNVWKERTLTHRELLQDFGTICRNFDEDCWVLACWTRIKNEKYPFIVIDDCRYLNEINISKENGAKIILLENQPIKDNHASEQVLNFDRSLFDFIIDNTKMTLAQKNEELTKIINSIGWSKAILQ